MEDRKRLILEIIIKEHVSMGLPVSSAVLVDKYALPCSSATARNDMAELEADGLIMQPHTSAGRVPTEKAYRWFIDNLDLENTNKEALTADIKLPDKPDDQDFKQVAKDLSVNSGLAIFWAFNRRNVYYTGFTNLLSQPEFATPGLIYNLSAIIDHLDEMISACFDRLPDEPNILIGSDCPFGDFLATIVTKYKYNNQVGAFGLIGPLRLDYVKNINLVKNIKKQI